MVPTNGPPRHCLLRKNNTYLLTHMIMMGLIKIVIFCENFKSTDCPSVSNSIFKPKWLSQWWWSSLLYYVVHEGKITNNYCEIETIDMSNKNYKKKSENNFKQCCFLLFVFFWTRYIAKITKIWLDLNKEKVTLAIMF